MAELTIQYGAMKDVLNAMKNAIKRLEDEIRQTGVIREPATKEN